MLNVTVASPATFISNVFPPYKARPCCASCTYKSPAPVTVSMLSFDVMLPFNGLTLSIVVGSTEPSEKLYTATLSLTAPLLSAISSVMAVTARQGT